MGSFPPRRARSLDEELAALRARTSSLGEENAAPPLYQPVEPRQPSETRPDAGLLERADRGLGEALARLRLQGTAAPDVFGKQYEPEPEREPTPDLDRLNMETVRSIEDGAKRIRDTQGESAAEEYVRRQHENLYGKRVGSILNTAREKGRELLRTGATRAEAEQAAADLAQRHIETLEEQIRNGERTRDAAELSNAYEGLKYTFTTPKGLARLALTTGAPIAAGMALPATAGAIITAGVVAGTTALSEALAQKTIDERPVDWREALASGVTNIMEIPALQAGMGIGEGIANPILRRAVQTGTTAASEAFEEASQRVAQDVMMGQGLPSGPALAGEAIGGALVGGPIGGVLGHGGQAHAALEGTRRAVVDTRAGETDAATPPPKREAAEVPAESLDTQLTDIETALAGARASSDLLAIQTLEQSRQEILDARQAGLSAPVSPDPPQPGQAGPVAVAPAPAPAPAPPVAGPAVTPVIPGAAPPPGPGAGVTVAPGVPPQPVSPGALSPVEAARLRAQQARPTVQGLVEAAQAQAAGEPVPIIPPPVGAAPPELGVISARPEGIAPQLTVTPVIPEALAVGVPLAAPTLPPVAPAVAPPAPGVAPAVLAPPVEPGAFVAPELAPAAPGVAPPLAAEDLVAIAQREAAARPVAPAPNQAEIDRAAEEELARLQTEGAFQPEAAGAGGAVAGRVPTISGAAPAPIPAAVAPPPAAVTPPPRVETKGPVKPKIVDLSGARQKAITTAIERFPDVSRETVRGHVEEQMWRRKIIDERQADYDYLGRPTDLVTGQKIKNRAAKRRAAKLELKNAQALYDAGWETVGSYGSPGYAPYAVRRLRVLLEGGGIPTAGAKETLPLTTMAYHSVKGWVDHVAAVPLEQAVANVQEYAKAYPQEATDVLDALARLATDIDSMGEQAMRLVVDLPGIGRAKIKAALEAGPDNATFQRIVEYRQKAEAEERAFRELMAEHETESFEHPALVQIADNLEEDLANTDVDVDDHPLMKTFMWGIVDPATGEQATTTAAVQAIRDGKGRLFSRIREAYTDAMSVMQSDIPFDVPEGAAEEGILEAPRTREGQELLPGFMEAVITTPQKPVARKGEPSPTFADMPLFTQEEDEIRRAEEKRLKEAQKGLFEAPKPPVLQSGPQDDLAGRYGPPPKKLTPEQQAARNRWAAMMKGGARGVPAPSTAATAGPTEGAAAVEAERPAPGGAGVAVGEGAPGGGRRGGRGPGVPAGVQTGAGGTRETAAPAPRRGGIFHIVNPREAETLERPAKSDLIPQELRQHLTPEQTVGTAKAIEALKAGVGFLFEDGTGVGKTRELLATAHHFVQQGKKVLIVSKAGAIEPKLIDGKWQPTGSYADDSATMGIPIEFVKKRGVPLKAGVVNLGTYYNLRQYQVDADTVLFFDEAHMLKNAGDSEVAAAGNDLIRRAGTTGFATATPGDKPYHMSYLASIGFFEGKDPVQALKDLGVKVVRKQKLSKPLYKGYLAQGMSKDVAREKAMETVEVWQTTNPRKMRRAVEQLFGRLTRQGTVVKREVDLTPIQVVTHKIALPPEAHAVMNRIEEGNFDRKNALMHMRRQQEPYKLDNVMQLTRDELAQGRQVVIFATRVNKSEVREKLRGPEGDIIGEQVIAESEGTLKQLAERLEAEDIPYSEIHGGAAESSDMAQARFQRGEAKVVIATYEKGGTGINLDDRSGAAPRSMVIMTAPFDSVSIVQAIGRVHRMTTRSPSRVHLLFSDHGLDAWNGGVLGGKLKQLHAMVSGDIAALDLAGLGADEEELNAGAVHYIDAARVLGQHALPGERGRVKSAKHWGLIIRSLKGMGVDIGVRGGGEFAVQTHEGFTIEGSIEKGGAANSRGYAPYGTLIWHQDDAASEFHEAAKPSQEAPHLTTPAALSLMREIGPTSGAQRDVKAIVSWPQYTFMKNRLDQAQAVWSAAQPGTWHLQTRDGHWLTGELVPPVGEKREGRLPDAQHGAFYWIRIDEPTATAGPEGSTLAEDLTRLSEDAPAGDDYAALQAPTGIVGRPTTPVVSYVRPHLDWRKPARLGQGVQLQVGTQLLPGVKVAQTAIREGFSTIGGIEFNGLYVPDTENAAAVFHTTRNPSIEHSAFFLTDEKGIVRASMQVSSQAPNYVRWPSTLKSGPEIREKIQELARQGVRITGIYNLHNHPSGNLTPSARDLETVGAYAQAFGPLWKGAAIIDHESATIIPPSGKHYRVRKSPTSAADPDPFYQGAEAAEYYQAKAPALVKNTGALRAFASSLMGTGLWRENSNVVSLMFLDSSSRLTLTTFLPRQTFMDPEAFKLHLSYLGRLGRGALAYAAAPGMLTDPGLSGASAAHVNAGLLVDAFDLGKSFGGVQKTLQDAGTYYGRPGIPWQEILNPIAAGGMRLDEPAPSAHPDWQDKADPEWWRVRVKFAEARTRSRLTQANLGIDPRAFWDAFVLGVDAVRRGATTFASWLKRMAENVPWIGRYGREMFGYLQSIGAPVTITTQGRPLEFAKAIERVGPELRAYKGPVRPIPAVTDSDMLKMAEAIVRGEQGAPANVAGGKPIGVGKSRDFPINIHQIADEGQIKNAVARGARALYDRLAVARRPRTMAEVHSYALRLGYSEADWHRMVREKGALTAEEITIGRIFRQEAGVDFGNKWEAWREAEQHAKEPGLSDVERDKRKMELLDAEREKQASLQKFIGFMYGTAAAASESGRALRAHAMLAQTLSPEERFLYRLFRGKRTDQKLMAELVEALRKDDMARAGELVRKVQRPGILRMTVEYYINSLLSAPSTSIANVAGNFIHEAVLRTPERAIAARLEQFGIRQGVERLLTGQAKPTERVVGEATEALKAQVFYKFGLPAALSNTMMAITREDIKFMRSLKGEFYPPAIPGVFGKIVRIPGRVMEGLDLAARQAAMGAEQSAQLWRRAYADAHKNGWSIGGEEFGTRLKELHTLMSQWILLEEQRLADPTSFQTEYGADGYKFLYRHRDLARVYDDMKHAGDVSTFRDATTRFTSIIKSLRNAYPALSFVIPFIHTTERLLVQGFRRTPLGLAKTVYNIRSGSIEGGEASDRLAQGILGTMVTAAIYMIAADGLITGGGPEDPRDRENWLKTGKLPYAVRVGNKWISYARLEPLATSFGLAADLAQATDEKLRGDVFDKLHYSVLNQITNKTYLQGIISAAEAVGDPDRYGGRLWKQMLGAAVPNLLASAARAIDPTIRETDSIANTLMARVPVLSSTLPPRLTGTGEPLKRPETALSRFFSPVRYNEEAGPERNLERIFLDAGYSPSQPPRSITLPGTMGRKVDLTPDERRIFGAYAARATAFARGLTTQNDWSGLDVYAKRELLERIYRFTSDAARRDVLRSVTARLRSGAATIAERK